MKRERSRWEEADGATLAQGKVPLCRSAAAAEFSSAESMEMQSELGRRRNESYILGNTATLSFLPH